MICSNDFENFIKNDKFSDIIKRVIPKYNEKTIDMSYKNLISSLIFTVDVTCRPFLTISDIYSIPDFLIKGKDIPSLFFMLRQKETKFNFIFEEDEYIPIEIHNSPIEVDENDLIVNKDRAIIYKTSLYSSRYILHNQNKKCRYGIIIGKNKNIGIVDFTGNDIPISVFFHDAYSWLRSTKLTYAVSNFFYNIDPEFYPNMKSENYTDYSKEKEEYAEKLGEITSVYYCSFKNRENAHKVGIFSIFDNRLNSKILGINKSQCYRVDKILEVNRGEIGDYSPKKIHCYVPDNEFTCFVDFEVVNDFIFLIGVFFKNKYTYFLMSELTLEDEDIQLSKFFNWLYDNNIKTCIYWFAEINMLKKAYVRHKKVYVCESQWFDLYKVFYNEPIVIKGCKNFKLKNIVKSLKKLNYITIEKDCDSCENGLEAMQFGLKYYENKNLDILRKILIYNELDCVYLEKLINFVLHNLK